MISLLYIDPSAMTYAIQVITGIVVALGAGLGIFFRKIKRKMKIKNTNKEVETDEIIVK